jgi:hypothetical protein
MNVQLQQVIEAIYLFPFFYIQCITEEIFVLTCYRIIYTTVLGMEVVPINFSQEHKEMLAHTKYLLDRERVAISPKHGKLLAALKTAVGHDSILDK